MSYKTETIFFWFIMVFNLCKLLSCLFTLIFITHFIFLDKIILSNKNIFHFYTLNLILLKNWKIFVFSSIEFYKQNKNEMFQNFKNCFKIVNVFDKVKEKSLRLNENFWDFINYLLSCYVEYFSTNNLKLKFCLFYYKPLI